MAGTATEGANARSRALGEYPAPRGTRRASRHGPPPVDDDSPMALARGGPAERPARSGRARGLMPDIVRWGVRLRRRRYPEGDPCDPTRGAVRGSRARLARPRARRGRPSPRIPVRSALRGAPGRPRGGRGPRPGCRTTSTLSGYRGGARREARPGEKPSPHRRRGAGDLSRRTEPVSC
jgi:hypothetical protein